MLIDYDTLQSQLAPETLDNLIREYLFRQIGDEGFDQVDSKGLISATEQVRAAMAKGDLVVEYAEDDQSIAIRSKQDLITSANGEFEVS